MKKQNFKIPRAMKKEGKIECVYIYIRGYLKVVEKQRFSCIQFILYSLTLRRPSTRSFSTDPLFARNTREKNIVEIVAK